MQLCYRGIPYQSPAVESYINENKGTAMYRGRGYKIDKTINSFGVRTKPPSSCLKYRGINYIYNAE
jgi:hypothetical protein